MKRNWSRVELEEFWQILPDERKLLAKKTGLNRLLFILLLKFFCYKGRFPETIYDYPTIAFEYLKEQSKINGDIYLLDEIYKTNSRNINRYKKEIRDFLSFVSFGQKECALVEEFILELLKTYRNDRQLLEQVYIKLQYSKIEPPDKVTLTNIILKTKNSFEKRLFHSISNLLSSDTKIYLDHTILGAAAQQEVEWDSKTTIGFIKQGSGKSKNQSLKSEIEKYKILKKLNLTEELFREHSRSFLAVYKRRVMGESPENLRLHPDYIRYGLVSIFCKLRLEDITDNLVDHLINCIHQSKKQSKKVETQILMQVGNSSRDFEHLYEVATAARDHPEDIIKNVIYPKVPREQIDSIIKARYLVKTLKELTQTKLINSYNLGYRKKIFDILNNIKFESNQKEFLEALTFVKQHQACKGDFYPSEIKINLLSTFTKVDCEFIYVQDNNGNARISRKDYEYAVLKSLRDKLKTKEVWVIDALRYRDPEEDLPKDFNQQYKDYFKLLNLPLSAQDFTSKLKQLLDMSLIKFDKNIKCNEFVKITKKNDKPWIQLTPLKKQPEPKLLEKLKAAILQKWQVIPLLDILKEVDLLEDITSEFNTAASREILDKKTVRKRLLLCIFALGTNIGLKRVSAASKQDITFEELRYIKKRYLNQTDLREAITKVANAIFKIRDPDIWGEDITSCASDSKKFGSWDQNLMTEWHARYNGPGIMIYWHVSKQSVCVYSQLKSCSSSEVASMIEGIVRQDSEMDIKSQYVDSHGKSEVGFAFSYLLGFELLPRYKDIGSQKLYIADNNDKFANIDFIVARSINWQLIENDYYEMVKNTIAVKIGTANSEDIIRKFSRNNYQHPTYKAFLELGKVIKTIFLCNYLDSLELRQEIHSGLNVIENWNSVNNFIFYGKSGEMATNNREDQEISMLCLHLLQISLAYINTILIQETINQNGWKEKLSAEDYRALSALIYLHINPYGFFELDMNKRLGITIFKR